MRYAILAVPLALLTAALSSVQSREDKVLRVGIIGLDTSHVTAFTKLLNDPKVKPELAGCKVVAGFPGGSPDIPDSRNRVEKFTAELKGTYGVEIVDSIEALLPKVDVVLLESVDGRPHLKQVEPVLKAGKRCFIDKPVAGTLADAIAIYDLAKKHNVPVFSSSSLRYYPAIQKLRNDPDVGKVLGCTTYGPCSLEPHHPDLFWYGVHGVEALFTIMGTGCETVSRTHTDGTDVAIGTWKDGRIGSFRGIRSGKSDYGAIVFGEKTISQRPASGSYEPLVVEIVKYFRGGPVPVSPEETLEMFAFMEGADISKQRGGAAVKLADVMEAARKK
jgi:hypothetical protein